MCAKPAPPFEYIDEAGNHHAEKKHVRGGKTIKWVLEGGCNGSDLAIHFSKSPFVGDATDPIPGRAYTLRGDHDPSYKYTVSLKYNGTPVTPDDPQIMFDDVRSLTERGLFDDTLEEITKSADAVWKGFFDHFTDAVKVEAASDRVLFPKGISLISVEIDAPAGIKVVVKVAGPDAPSGG